MEQQEILDELISKAAKDADIHPSQAKMCIQSALDYINEAAKRLGYLDLSSFIPGAYARSENICKNN